MQSPAPAAAPIRRVVVGPAVLYLGDCRKALKFVPDESCGAVITDPPYGMNYVPSHRVLLEQKKIANDQVAPLWSVPMMADKLRGGTALYLFTSWEIAELWKQAIMGASLLPKTPIFWDKLGSGTQGDLYGDFARRIEICLFAHKGRHLLKSKRYHNYWPFKRPPPELHPTPKPVEMLKRMVESSTIRGDIVLDPFMGTGSTGVAAVSMGRRFIGMELDPGYFQTAYQRIARAAKLKR